MKRANLFWITTIATSLASAAVQSANGDTKTEFAHANQEYSEGHFQEAVNGYQKLVNAGDWSANLFYDLGNAWFRLGNFGEAMLNYERAVALDPHHPEAAANLSLVRDEARALELRRSGIERYIGAGTAGQYCVVAAVAFWLLLFSATRLFLFRRRSLIMLSLVIFATVTVASAVFAIYSLETGSRGQGLAIVTGRKIEARLATADNSNSILALPPGSEIKVLSHRGDWLYAKLPNDLRGWIPASGAERVRLALTRPE